MQIVHMVLLEALKGCSVVAGDLPLALGTKLDDGSIAVGPALLVTHATTEHVTATTGGTETESAAKRRERRSMPLVSASSSCRGQWRGMWACRQSISFLI
jgi:hypothetical protein